MTRELNLKNTERRWNLAYRYEMAGKKRFLRKLSEQNGFRILQELHKFAYNSKARSTFNILDKDKINTLSKVHSIFGKVKP